MIIQITLESFFQMDTVSGRAALRGKVNKFGTLDARPNEKKVLYDKFKSVMNGGGGQEESTTEGMVSDISVGSKVLAKSTCFSVLARSN